MVCMRVFVLILFFGLLSCTQSGNNKIAADSTAQYNIGPVKDDTTPDATPQDTVSQADVYTENINTGNTTADALMSFAETQLGVPYVYASCDPKVGFDCSGFITYVFGHFNIKVPRSSYGFTHMGKTIPFNKAKRGDIILFTGTDSLATDIGHIGLVVSNNNGALNFIHATSGKAMAVTITTFDEHYKKRFVRISRVFAQNG